MRYSRPWVDTGPGDAVACSRFGFVPVRTATGVSGEISNSPGAGPNRHLRTLSLEVCGRERSDGRPLPGL